jgi:hypothetical protein
MGTGSLVVCGGRAARLPGELEEKMHKMGTTFQGSYDLVELLPAGPRCTSVALVCVSAKLL